MFPAGGWDYGILGQAVGAFLSDPFPYGVVLLVMSLHVLAFVRRSLMRLLSRV
jgi:hypothetical protein